MAIEVTDISCRDADFPGPSLFVTDGMYSVLGGSGPIIKIESDRKSVIKIGNMASKVGKFIYTNGEIEETKNKKILLSVLIKLWCAKLTCAYLWPHVANFYVCVSLVLFFENASMLFNTFRRVPLFTVFFDI
ncbi:MAG: hypothetical protein LBQ23_04410 [Puniceicoccales bacterium]|jgi:hypothetical protein|nr:hypothetical protein [Puniceicoccales bacterium]